MIKEGGEGGYRIVDGRVGGHEHDIVHCEGVGLFVLRTRRECRRYGMSLECDEGYFPSIRERAKIVVQRLNDAVELWEHEAPGAATHKDEFHELTFETKKLADGTGIFLVPGHGAEGRLIVTVTEGDVVGYRRRSPHPHVTQELVAAWWQGLTTDIFYVLVLHEPPCVIVNTQQGAILNKVARYAGQDQLSESGHHVDLSELSSGERLDLKRLSTKIPEDFSLEDGDEHHEEEEVELELEHKD